MKKFSVLIFMVSCIVHNSYANIFSWSVDGKGLQLADSLGVVNSNNSVMQDTNHARNFIRTSDIVIDRGYQFIMIFVGFQKKHLSSFVRVKLFDVFTDEELLSIDFQQQDIEYITNQTIITRSVYLRVELHGSDIELRAAGLEAQFMKIINEQQIALNKTVLLSNEDYLEITIPLQDSAELTVFIYDRNGNLCDELISKKVLNKGEYKFYFDPEKLSYNYLSEKKYYVWIKASNLRSAPVEFVKQFQVIPR